MVVNSLQTVQAGWTNKLVIDGYGQNSRIYMQTNEMEKNKIFSNIVKIGKGCKVKKIILFGSLSKGNNTEYSDIDLIFIFETVDENFVERSAKYLNLLYDKISGYDIDLLVYTEHEWNNIMKNKPFFKEIEEGGTILYEY